MSTLRLPRRDFGIVFTVLLIVSAGNTALQSVVPAIGRSLAIPDIMVSAIFSVSALIWTLAAPMWARASDRQGRKALMQVGLAGFAVSMLLGGAVIHAGLAGWIAPVTTVVLFGITRMLFGYYGSASNPAAQAYVASRTTEAERTPALAMLASAFGLGTILGPALAPVFVLPSVGLSGPLYAFALIAAVTIALLVWLLPHDTPVADTGGAQASMPTLDGGSTGATVTAALAGKRGRLSWRDPRIFPYTMFGLCAGSAQAASGQTMGFLIIDRIGGRLEAAQPMIGLAFMAGAGATLLVQWGVMRRFEVTPGAALRWGAVLSAAGLLATGLATDYHGIVLAYALTSAGFGFVRPGFTAGASLAVGMEEQGPVAGAVTAVNGAAFIIAPTIGIGLYELWRPLPYFACAVAMVALFVWTLTNPRLRVSG